MATGIARDFVGPFEMRLNEMATAKDAGEGTACLLCAHLKKKARSNNA